MEVLVNVQSSNNKDGFMSDPRLTDGELCDIIGRIETDYRHIPGPDSNIKMGDLWALLRLVLGEHFDYAVPSEYQAAERDTHIAMLKAEHNKRIAKLRAAQWNV